LDLTLSIFQHHKRVTEFRNLDGNNKATQEGDKDCEQKVVIHVFSPFWSCGFNARRIAKWLLDGPN
jgi:hypothetical protein